MRFTAASFIAENTPSLYPSVTGYDRHPMNTVSHSTPQRAHRPILHRHRPRKRDHRVHPALCQCAVQRGLIDQLARDDGDAFVGVQRRIDFSRGARVERECVPGRECEIRKSRAARACGGVSGEVAW